MVSVLIVSDDKDEAALLSLILDQAGYKAVHVETVAELIEDLATFGLMILDRFFNLSPDDWDVLKKLKEADERELPIVITNSPQTPWLQQKNGEVGIDMIFPYPSDLTIEIPAFLEACFGG